MYYFEVENAKIKGSTFSVTQIEQDNFIQVSKDKFELVQEKGLNYFIYKNNEFILNPDYEREQEEKEKERVKMLSCTKRDFALMLQEIGITYTQLKELIAQNEQAQLEWDLCERLYRFNPLLDVMAAQLGISSLQLDMIFKTINGENTVDELKSV